jgi:hypothetical protein
MEQKTSTKTTRKKNASTRGLTVSEVSKPTLNLIRNKSRDKDAIGTIGGYVKDPFGRVYGMTCLHVAKGNISDWNLRIGDESDEIVNEKGIVGELDDKILDKTLDVAFIKIKKKDNANNDHIGNPKSIYDIKDKDEKELKIQIFSEKQGKTIEGVVVKIYKDESVSLILKNTADKDAFVDLIGVSTATAKGKSLTEAGDSGAWVRTIEDNKVVGMVIGADFHNEITYVIKMRNILDFFTNYELL